MRVLVLGGTNFIGPHAVRRLVDRGHEVTVFHRGQHNTPLPPDVRHIHGDRRQLAEHLAELRGATPDVVLDMAGGSQHDGETVSAAFRGFARRIVAISSVDVYRAYDRFRGADPGEPDPSPLTEDSPLRDRLYPYAETPPPPEKAPFTYDKILMERAFQSAPEELPATILRLPMVYGPGDYQHRVHSYLKRMDDQRPYIPIPDYFLRWHGLRSYVEDIGEAIALCVTDDRAAGRVYHVSEQDHATEGEWAGRIAEAAGWDGRIIGVPRELLPEHMRDIYDTTQEWELDSSRIRRELGYAEPTPPREAMRRTIAWERENPPATVDPAEFDYAAEDAAFGELVTES